MKTKKQNYFQTLPKQLLSDINKLNQTKIGRNKSLILINQILRQSNQIFSIYTASVPLPKALLLKMFGKKYYTTTTPLIDAGILERTGYSADNGMCRHYSVNSKYFEIADEMETICFNVKKEVRDLTLSSIERNTIKHIKSLKIDVEGCFKIMNRKIEEINENSFNVNEAIQDSSFKVTLKLKGMLGISYYSTKEKHLETARKHSLTLIKDKNTYFIMDLPSFLIQKKNAIRLSYTDSIIKLKKKYIFAKRNTTNNRLDTNLTNLCADITDYILKCNGLAQLDLVNSQFAIYSHTLSSKNMTDEKKLFKDLSNSGHLYTYVQKELGLKTRREAKILMFELFFSSENNKSDKIVGLKDIFPGVISEINEFKKKYGYATFSINLQKMESKMFIDDILAELMETTSFAITKHDSIIIKEEELNIAKEFIELYFTSIGFGGQMK